MSGRLGGIETDRHWFSSHQDLEWGKGEVQMDQKTSPG